MTRRLCSIVLLFSATACGARTELEDPNAACADVSIGIFGRPGAYVSSEFDNWLKDSGAGVKRVQGAADEPLTKDTLKPFDVIVLDWLARDYTPEEAAILADWVADGGGVVSMTGYDNVTFDDWHANSLIAPLGVAYSGPLLNGPVTDLAKHPITAGLSSVVFKGGYAISDLGSHSSTLIPIAFLPVEGGNVTVGYEVQMGTGRGFIWGDEWIEFLSNGSMFPPRLWVQVFARVSPPKTCALIPPE